MDSLIKVIKKQIQKHSNREAFLFANEDILRTLDQRLDTTYQGYTHAEMDVKFRAVAAVLQMVAQKGERVLILHQPGEAFITSFMGCLYAGMIAVPIYPPNPARLERTLPHFLAIIKDAMPSVVLTNELFQAAAQDFLTGMELAKEPTILLSSTIEDKQAANYQEYNPQHDEVAFFQYTSGSTGKPKGVMLTHGNLLDNLECIRKGYKCEEGGRKVSWLPPYHDMGLIGSVLNPLYLSESCFVMSPMDFLKDPNRWIQAMHWYKATYTGGPNFGYELTARKFKPETFKQLDLSNWKIAVNGAEPIKHATIQQFVNTFQPYGFREATFCLSYGMSEATSMVSGGSQALIKPKYVQRGALEKNRKIIEASKATPETRTVLSCGPIAEGFDVRLVDPVTLKESGQDYAGEIWLKSKSIGLGYWNDAEKTAATFHATLSETQETGFLRTGDYGFIRDNQLYITGRLKDLIIIRGRNYHPEDIEHTVNKAHKNFAPGACAAFAVTDEHGERLVVVQEIVNKDLELSAEEINAMFQKATVAVSEKHGIQLSEFVIIKNKTIHKTGSGKISRIKNYKAWENNSLEVVFNNKVTTFLTQDLPQTATEQKLAQIWEQLLKITGVERSSDFMEYGGDSMAVVELSGAIRETFNFPATPDMIYKYSVLSALARAIDEGQVDLASIDLDEEITLSLKKEAIQKLPIADQQEVILLTGATGFLGRYLLSNLLEKTTVKKVIVLLRDQDLEKGKARVVEKFETHQLSLTNFDKIDWQYGDLARPRLGMSQQEFVELGEKVDVIYHCGAMVDWVKPYTSLRATNVDGTRTLIHLAATGKLKPLHYISTMWVVNSGVNTEEYKDYDETHRAGWRGLENGYAQSKWVAENLIFKAADLGIPTTSHRMDFIVGSSSTGVIPKRDFLVRLVQDMMTYKIVPKQTIYLDIVEVDFLAKAIVALGSQPQPPGKVFHFRGNEQLSTKLMADLLIKRGYLIQERDYLDWVATVTKDNKSKSWPLKFFLEAYAMSPVITNPEHNNTNVVKYDRTISDLGQLGVSPEQHHPTVKAIFQQMITYLEQIEEEVRV